MMFSFSQYLFLILYFMTSFFSKHDLKCENSSNMIPLPIQSAEALTSSFVTVQMKYYRATPL